MYGAIFLFIEILRILCQLNRLKGVVGPSESIRGRQHQKVFFLSLHPIQGLV